MDNKTGYVFSCYFTISVVFITSRDDREVVPYGEVA